MTDRMIAAVRNQHVDVLGHCTGRLLGGRGRRPESVFDAKAVFTACRDEGVAVEINCRPERRDPADPAARTGRRDRLRLRHRHRRARAGQLDWQVNGTVRAEQLGITADRVINTSDAEELLSRRSSG